MRDILFTQIKIRLVFQAVWRQKIKQKTRYITAATGHAALPKKKKYKITRQQVAAPHARKKLAFFHAMFTCFHVKYFSFLSRTLFPLYLYFYLYLSLSPYLPKKIFKSVLKISKRPWTQTLIITNVRICELLHEHNKCCTYFRFKVVAHI